MSYLVLARKWRPQTFDQVIGQPHVTKTLQNAVRAGRIAHAYLFTGARGVGKTSVARILAKALNCEQGVSPQPCNECSNCREITQGHAMDVLEIDGASNRGIDNIRELRETVRYRPAKSLYKIYIIDEVHMLTGEAFNALLKTLEEPPEHIVFVFATTEPHKIPATILSRCQRFDFRRIPTSQILAHLTDIAHQESLQLPTVVLHSLAREADGSMRDAQSLLEQVLAFSIDGQVDSDVLDLLGVIDRRSVGRVARAILQGDALTCLQVVADIYQRGIDSKRFCHQLCEYFRNLLFLAVGKTDAKGLLDLPAEELSSLEEELADINPESLQLYFQLIVKGEETIRRSSLPRIALEMLLLRLAQLPQLESLQSLTGKLNSLEAQLSRGITVTAAATVAPKPAASAVVEAGPEDSPPLVPAGPTSSLAEAVAKWGAFVQWLSNEQAFLGAKLMNSRAALDGTRENALELELAEIYEDSFKDPKTLARLGEAAKTFFGIDFQWVIKARPTGPAPAAEAKLEKKSRPESQVWEHPTVQQALEILGGELLDIRRLKTSANRPRAGAAETSHGEHENRSKER